MELRWMVRKDLPRVLEIEAAAFVNPWSEIDFLTLLQQRHGIGNVAEIDGHIVGFVVYELHRGTLKLINIAVCRHYLLQGVGSAMVQRLKDKLSQQRRQTLLANVRETNLAAQLFFRSQGFRCDRVLRDYYEDTDEAAYEFHYSLRERVGN